MKATADAIKLQITSNLSSTEAANPEIIKFMSKVREGTGPRCGCFFQLNSASLLSDTYVWNVYGSLAYRSSFCLTLTYVFLSVLCVKQSFLWRPNDPCPAFPLLLRQVLGLRMRLLSLRRGASSRHRVLSVEKMTPDDVHHKVQAYLHKAALDSAAQVV